MSLREANLLVFGLKLMPPIIFCEFVALKASRHFYSDSFSGSESIFNVSNSLCISFIFLEENNCLLVSF